MDSSHAVWICEFERSAGKIQLNSSMLRGSGVAGSQPYTWCNSVSLILGSQYASCTECKLDLSCLARSTQTKAVHDSNLFAYFAESASLVCTSRHFPFKVCFPAYHKGLSWCGYPLVLACELHNCYDLQKREGSKCGLSDLGQSCHGHGSVDYLRYLEIFWKMLNRIFA